MCNREISSRRIDCFFPRSSTTIRGRSPGGVVPTPPPPPLAKVAKYGKRARVKIVPLPYENPVCIYLSMIQGAPAFQRLLVAVNIFIHWQPSFCRCIIFRPAWGGGGRGCLNTPTCGFSQIARKRRRAAPPGFHLPYSPSFWQLL